MYFELKTIEKFIIDINKFTLKEQNIKNREKSLKNKNKSKISIENLYLRKQKQNETKKTNKKQRTKQVKIATGSESD